MYTGNSLQPAACSPTRESLLNNDISGHQRRALPNAILRELTIRKTQVDPKSPTSYSARVQVSFATSRMSVMKINNWTDRGIRYIRFGVTQDEPRWKRIGLSFLRRAQAEAASPPLHVARKISEQLPLDQGHHPASSTGSRRRRYSAAQVYGEMVSFPESRRNSNLLPSS